MESSCKGFEIGIVGVSDELDGDEIGEGPDCGRCKET